MSSKRKISSNRNNSRKSSGPHDTSSTRYNARKHGMLAGVTQLDDIQYRDELLADMIRLKKPVGMLENGLLERVAHDMVCLKRGERLEGEFITAALNPPLHEKNPTDDLIFQFNGAVIDPGIPASISVGCAQEMDRTYQRYRTSSANRLIRALHQFEREQRMRAGETLPAPIAVDVSVGAGPMHDGSAVPSAPHGVVEGFARLTDLPSGSAQKENLSTKSEAPEAVVCENANQQKIVMQDADARRCSAVAGSPDDLPEEEISPPNPALLRGLL